MKILRMATLLTLGLALAGCNHQTQAHSAAAPSGAGQHSSRTTAVKPQPVKLAWNAAKAKKLNAYIQHFGSAAAQVYAKADATSHTQWQGSDLSALISADKPVSFNGQTTKVTWLPTASAGSKHQPNIVAIYANNPDKILYLFTLTGTGKTKVWVSQTKAKLHILTVGETANGEVSQAFTAIVKGQPIQKAADQHANSASKSKPQTNRAPGDVQPVFDDRYQHTWFSFDTEDGFSQLHQLSFTANSMTLDGVRQPIYPATMRTAADNKGMTDRAFQDPARQKWGAASTFSKNGTQWLNMQGWYQSAGNGGYDRIVNLNLNGRMTPVLQTAHGSGVWHSANFYLSQTDAKTYRDKLFKGEHRQNSDHWP